MTLVADTREVTPPTAGELADAVDVVGRFVSCFEPATYSGADAATMVALFTRVERFGAAGKTLAATRAAAANCHLETGKRTPAHWLAGITGESVGNAIGVLDLGDAIEAHPMVGDAYRQGKLSPAGAKAVAGAVAVNPYCEEELLAYAEYDSLSQLRDRCLRAKAQGRSKKDAAEAYDAIRRSRSCRTWSDTDGAFRLEARLTPDAGAALLTALDAESNRVFERARASGAHESRDAYAADALVALVTGQGSAPAGADGPVRAPDPKATIHVLVDLGALRRGEVGEHERCEIPGVGPVAVETARSLMGDAITDLVITDGVDVTTVCHVGRSIPAPLKTALMVRDQHCVVPGCDVAHGLEFDHWMVPFAEGGPASLENLARLCSHHHYLRTHKGFQLGGGPGRWTWSGPGSTTDVPRCTLEE